MNEPDRTSVGIPDRAEALGTGARSPARSLATYSGFVKLEHTLFSLPLIVAGAWIGERTLEASGRSAFTPARAFFILLAAVGARTFALAMNRIIDRRLDAKNPRTAVRELPAGKIGIVEAWSVALAGGLVYVGAAAALSPLCLALSPVPLAVFVGYPYLKRITPLCHFGVGLALALSPLGGFVGMTGSLNGLTSVVPLALFALFWVAGFDVIYATLDETHDRESGIHSLPAKLGSRAALRISFALHLMALLALVGWITMRGAGPLGWIFLAVIAGLFAWQHQSARHVDLAFFRINAWLGFVVLALVIAGVS